MTNEDDEIRRAIEASRISFADEQKRILKELKPSGQQRPLDILASIPTQRPLLSDTLRPLIKSKASQKLMSELLVKPHEKARLVDDILLRTKVSATAYSSIGELDEILEQSSATFLVGTQVKKSILLTQKSELRLPARSSEPSHTSQARQLLLVSSSEDDDIPTDAYSKATSKITSNTAPATRIKTTTSSILTSALPQIIISAEPISFSSTHPSTYTKRPPLVILSDSEPDSCLPAPCIHKKSLNVSTHDASKSTNLRLIPRVSSLPVNNHSRSTLPQNQILQIIESDGKGDAEDSDMIEDSLNNTDKDERLLDDLDEDFADGYQGISTLGDQSRIQGYLNQFDPAAQKPRRGRAGRGNSSNDAPPQSSSSSFRQPQSRARGSGRGRGRRSRFKSGRRGKRVKSMALPA